MKRIRTLLLVAGALGALVLPAQASAKWQDVVKDCAEDGKLDSRYSQEELKDAEDNLPSDINEYTPCAEVIAAARRSGGGGSATSPREGTSSGVATASGAIAQTSGDVADLRNATADARKRGRAPVAAAGQTLRPAAGSLDEVPGVANELPVPLLIAMAAVAGLCLVGGIVAARRRFGDIARAPKRLLRR